MIKKIIIINGCGGCGKDTFIEIMSTILTDQNNRVENLSTIDPIKEVALQLGWDNTKDDKGRLFLVELKQAWKKYNNGPVKYINKRIKRCCNIKDLGFYIFVHCREINEINEFKNLYPESISLLITRPGIQIESNSSDMFVNDYEYDYFIENDGEIDQLTLKAQNFADKIKE